MAVNDFEFEKGLKQAIKDEVYEMIFDKRIALLFFAKIRKKVENYLDENYYDDPAEARKRRTWT